MKYVHIGMNVSNLEASIAFYSKVFGVSPIKVKPTYSKFLLEQPGLNFTLNVKDEVNGNQSESLWLPSRNTRRNRSP